MRAEESRTRIALSVAAPALLLLVAWGFWSVDAAMPLIATVLVLAVLLGYVVAFDFPTSIEVDSTGINRVCLFRRHVLEWDDILGIVQPRRGGLVVMTKDRKRHVLLDRLLEPEELDVLRVEAERNEVRIEF
jgi:hypothetical protein